MRGTNVVWWLLFAAACGTPSVRVEGMTPGDCEDGADNDVDGMFDCADPSCAGAPSCDVIAVDAGSPDAGALGLPDGSSPDGGITFPSGTTFPERDFVCPAGLATPCATTEPAQRDEERTRAVSGVVRNETLTFVVSALSIPEASGGVAAGFNLDGLDSGEGSLEASAGCEEFNVDYVSLLDPAHVGVDNAYQGLISTVEGFLLAEDCPGGITDGCLDALLDAQIDAGATMLIEVRGVDDLQYDSEVTVQLYGASPASGTPILAGGSIAPGQRFAGTPMGAPVTGDIYDGRVRVSGMTLWLASASGGLFAPTMTIHGAELRFDLSSTGLLDGQIGGTLSVDEIVAASDAGFRDAVRSVMDNVADVGPSADPLICTSVSMGLTFSATPAIRTP